ncbi:MAG: hypothetical protein QOH63_523 [Acidobacteriota bacterium]|jgi:predicted outer membrane lipoprotein|nr:hypothetical protein [Acidobacteriota bacterium]
MSHLWTIIFVTLLAIAFGLVAWHDHEDMKRQQRKAAAHEQRDKSKD